MFLQNISSYVAVTLLKSNFYNVLITRVNCVTASKWGLQLKIDFWANLKQIIWF